jgi:hypothetical protein
VLYITAGPHIGQIAMMGKDSKSGSLFEFFQALCVLCDRAEIAFRAQQIWLEYETVIKIDLPHLNDQVEARQVEA